MKKNNKRFLTIISFHYQLFDHNIEVKKTIGRNYSCPHIPQLQYGKVKIILNAYDIYTEYMI